ncbi:MAG: GEVED domain-containing protein [Flavobacteriales bacterium]
MIQTGGSFTSVEVNWTDVDGDVVAYSWHINHFGNAAWIGIVQSGTTDSSNVVIYGLMPNSPFMFCVTALCENDSTDISCISVDTYGCVSAANDPFADEIFEVTVNGMSNSSNCNTIGGPGSVLNQYSNYIWQTPFTIIMGDTNTISVNAGTCDNNHDVTVWAYIDLNFDGYLELDEYVFFSPFVLSEIFPGTPVTGVFYLPPNCNGNYYGVTLMRVILSNQFWPLPCGDYMLGETEDYLVDLVPQLSCPEAAIGYAGQTIQVQAPELLTGCQISSLVNDYNNTDDASGIYPEGETVVHWTAVVYGFSVEIILECDQIINAVGCESELFGCTDPSSCNYNYLAQCDDNSCIGPCIELCPMDFDLDGVIGQADLDLLVAQFGCVELCSSCDLNDDSVVNTEDLMLMISYMGDVCQ